MATKAFLEKAYLAYFGRPVDPTGLTDFAASTDTQVADAFAASAESKALYGTTFDYAQINAIYLALFNREAEKAGLEYWYAKVADKTFTAAGAAIAILNGAQNADKTAIENKLAASALFSAAVDTTAEMVGYSGSAAAASARAFLSTVTTTAATAAAVDAAVAAAVAAKTAVAGQTFTLTTGIDTGTTFTGTAGNDAFNATHLTLGASDVLVGGAGVDTLNIVDTGAAAFTGSIATVSGIENINIRNLNGSAAVAAVTEAVTVTVGALSAGQTLIVAGQTLTATTDLSASSVQAALAGTATSGTGYTLSGTLATTHTKAAGTAGTTVVYTGTATAGPITDLVVTGNAQSAVPQVSKYLISTLAVDTGGTGLVIQFVFNGATLRTDQFATAGTSAAAAVLVANAINGYAGKALATVDGAGGVVIISTTPVSIGAFAAIALDGAVSTTQHVAAYALSPKSKVVTISNDVAATTGTFTYNGTSVTTGTAGAATAIAAATAYVTAINTAAGATIASNVAGTSAAITINNGLTGVAIDNFAYTGATFAETSIVLLLVLSPLLQQLSQLCKVWLQWLLARVQPTQLLPLHSLMPQHSHQILQPVWLTLLV